MEPFGLQKLTSFFCILLISQGKLLDFFVSKAVVEALKGIKRYNLIVLHVPYLRALCMAFVYSVV